VVVAHKEEKVSGESTKSPGARGKRGARDKGFVIFGKGLVTRDKRGVQKKDDPRKSEWGGGGQRGATHNFQLW